MTRQTINRISLLLVLSGIGAAVAIYLTVPPAVTDPLLGDYRSSKRYQRELKMMGGQANVLADDFQEWFSDQWHGRELARTLVIVSIGTTLLFRLFASHPDDANQDQPEETGELK